MGFSIANNIRWLRKKSGLTQEQLAQRLFVTRQTVSLWELGKIHPDVDTLQKIADGLQVDLLQVLYGPEHHPLQRFSYRLLIWALLSGTISLLICGALTLAEWLMVQPDFITTPAFLVAGNAYLWMSLYGCPFLALVMGGILGHIAFPILPQVPKQRKRFAAALFVFCVIFISVYVAGIARGNLFGAGILAWNIQDIPWIFIPVGYALYYAGRMIAK